MFPFSKQRPAAGYQVSQDTVFLSLGTSHLPVPAKIMACPSVLGQQFLTYGLYIICSSPSGSEVCVRFVWVCDLADKGSSPSYTRNQCMHFDASQVRSEDGADQSEGLRQGSTGDDGGLNLRAPATRSVHPLWAAQNLSGKVFLLSGGPSLMA